MPHLFTVVGAQSMLTLCIENASLVLKYYQDGKEVASQNTNLPISENRWFHVVLSHSLNRLIRSNSSLMLSLDGMCNYEASFPYPVFDASARVFVGTRGVDVAYTGIPTAYTELAGEIGTIYLFNRSLEKSQARGIYLLGSNYMYNFEKQTSFEHEPTAPVDRALLRSLCDGSLTPSLLVNLSACIQDKEKRCVLDNTPMRFRPQKWNLPKDAREAYPVAVNGALLLNTFICLTKQIPSVIDSLGGVALFLPLFTQLDLMEPDAKEGDLSVNEEFTRKVFTLLSAAVVTPSSQQFMLQQNAFEIIAYLLQKVTPVHLTSALLDQLILLLESNSLSKELKGQLFDSFFQNPALWVYCPAEIQGKLYSYMHDVLASHENEVVADCIKKYGIQGFLHTIRYFYSEVAFQICDELNDEREYLKQWLALSGEFVHPLSGEVVAKRLSPEDCVYVREKVLMVVRDLLKVSSSLPQSVLVYLVNTILSCRRNGNDALLLDLLHLLDEVLATDNQCVAFINGLASFSHVSLDITGLEAPAPREADVKEPLVSEVESQRVVPESPSGLCVWVV